MDPCARISLPLPALDDVEGPRVPDDLPPVVDAHVHLFPDRVFDAMWRWFDRHAWPVRYRLYARQVVRFLLERGVERIVALHYSHTPGMARALNAFVAQLCRDEPRVTGLATVLPGEPDAEAIVAEAFAMGLAGVKIHCHVQCVGPDEPSLGPVYEACAAADLPLVMHAGREPKSDAYRRDPHAICSADRVAAVLAAHPRLRLVVPHLGSDEYEAYEKLLERFDNLWLDTSVAAADYFPVPVPPRIWTVRPERILYGTDFPNLPYAWDRELGKLLALGLGDDDRARILGGNATSLFANRPAAPR